MHNFINTAGEFLLSKCYSCLQHSFVQHLKSPELFEKKLNFRKETVKYQLYFPVTAHIPGGGHLSHLFLPPMACLLLRKMHRRSWVARKGTAEQGEQGQALADILAPCMSCAVLGWVLHTWVGKVGRGDSPSRDLGARAALLNLDRLVAKGEAERLPGQMVSGDGLWGHCEAGPNIDMDISQGTLFH